MQLTTDAVSQDQSSSDMRVYVNRVIEEEEGVDRGPFVAVIRKVLPVPARDRLRCVATDLQRPRALARFRKVKAAGKPLYLNLGSGTAIVEGWVNIDLVFTGADIAWNLRRGLPLDDQSVDGIFIEHVLEHIPLVTIFGLLDECRRVLKPGGIMRVSVPDFRKYAESYLGDAAFLEEMRPGRPTRLTAVQEVICRHGHRSMWDAPTMVETLSSAGFVEVHETHFGVSGLANIPDFPDREPESVYVEAKG